MKNYYQLLGITPQASLVDIKQAFRKLALQYHPDKNSAAQAVYQFKDINLAYQTLVDPVKRAKYDLLQTHLSSTSMPSPTPVSRSTYDITRHDQQTTYDLIVDYLPYFQWISWAGIGLTLLLAVDYLLPPHYSKEKITHMEDIYYPISNDFAMYDHTILIVEHDREFTLTDTDVTHFRGQQFVKTYSTPLFFNIIFITPENKEYRVSASLIYGNLSFLPLILLLVSLLSVSVRNKIELSFSCSVVSSILFFIVLFLLFI